MKKWGIQKFAYWLKIILVVSVLVGIVRGFIFIPMGIEGNSMEKTLAPNDHIIYEKFSEINRFDLILFSADDGTTMVKRVIGLPGEHIRYEDDDLYVNNKIIDEPFLSQKEIKRNSNQYTTNFDSAELTDHQSISKDSYFVLGDNRRISKDSRSFGEVKIDQVIGKARMVYFPIKHIKIL